MFTYLFHQIIVSTLIIYKFYIIFRKKLLELLLFLNVNSKIAVKLVHETRETLFYQAAFLRSKKS